MKKHNMIISALTLCLTLSQTTAFAAAGNYKEENVTWIGTQAEYQKTLDSFFQGGVRKVKADNKFGIVDPAGNFVAPPIYDSIGLRYLQETDDMNNPVVDSSEPLEQLFLNGYAQVTRNGKMGLINQNGVEVIPAQYDAVGLPSEGICRISVQAGTSYYLGYWSLELGREIVPPNKYIIGKAAASAEGAKLRYSMIDRSSVLDAIMLSIDGQDVWAAGSNRLLAQHDFNNGYAFVSTGIYEGNCQYGTIIDKTGQEILPGGPYLFRTDVYPQFGPYMVYCKLSDTPYNSDYGNLGQVYQSGVVGPQGIIIPAQYTGGVRTPITGAYVGDARMTIIPELGLVITAKDVSAGKENGAKVGVVNFKNQTVIPFVHDFNYFKYDSRYKVFIGKTNEGDRIYNATGNRINTSNYYEVGANDNFSITNGYAVVSKANSTSGFVNIETGKEFLFHQTSPYYSNPSVNGLVWQENAAGKLGLIDMNGNLIIPHVYDAVKTGDHWERAKNGYAIVTVGSAQGIVTSSGAQIVPCEYKKFDTRGLHGPSGMNFIVATRAEGTGLLSLVNGAVIIPCTYSGIGGWDAWQYTSADFATGVEPVKQGNNYLLVDQSGTPIPGSQRPKIYTPKRGLFYTDTRDYIGPEGKIVFPTGLNYSGRKNFILDDMTLVVKDGKVGYINAALLGK